MRRKLELGDIGLALLWAIVLILLIVFTSYEAEAQDTAITVCRDPYTEWPRYEFHNMPTGWIDGSEAFWYLADGAGFIDDVFVADAYPLDSDNGLAGMVVVGSTDYSVEIRGDAQTPVCEVLETTLEPSFPVMNTCPAWAWDTDSKSMICLWDLPRATS